jgi:hypothetical protein
MLDLMPYVVKAVSASDAVMWLTPPGLGGFRSLAPRSRAQIHSNLRAARAAIAEMPWVFTDIAISFSSVDADEEVRAPFTLQRSDNGPTSLGT